MKNLEDFTEAGRFKKITNNIYARCVLFAGILVTQCVTHLGEFFGVFSLLYYLNTLITYSSSLTVQFSVHRSVRPSISFFLFSRRLQVTRRPLSFSRSNIMGPAILISPLQQISIMNESLEQK